MSCWAPSITKPATGDDNQAEHIDVTVQGGAAGTTLDSLTINGDKRLDGLTDGDIFFDTAPGGLGSYQSQPLQIVSHDGFTVTSATVADGGTLITFHFSGFQAGDKLRFSIDADEAQYVERCSGRHQFDRGRWRISAFDHDWPVFGPRICRSLAAGPVTGMISIQISPLRRASTGITLDLPNDNYAPDHDYTDLTAGAIADAAQIPLATISGYVYHDQDNNGIFDHTNEHAISGVTLELLDANGNGTGITTTTSTDPANTRLLRIPQS